MAAEPYDDDSLTAPEVRCDLCGLMKDAVDHDGHGLGECVAVCEQCKGSGQVEMQHYATVTREMAMDACEASMEGQEVPWGTEEVTCGVCNGMGGTPFPEPVVARDLDSWLTRTPPHPADGDEL